METAPGTGARVGALSGRLREQTRSAHTTAEAAFDLDRRLTTVADYGDGLVVLDAFHRAWSPALTLAEPVLPVALRAGPARRLTRLGQDLARLGRTPDRLDTDPDLLDAARDAASPPRTPDGALGAWYVLEGAALGGLVIASEVRRRLPQAASATSYFAGEGRATAARWRLFTERLDSWVPSTDDGEAVATRVVDGALTTFAALTEWLGVIT